MKSLIKKKEILKLKDEEEDNGIQIDKKEYKIKPNHIYKKDKSNNDDEVEIEEEEEEEEENEEESKPKGCKYKKIKDRYKNRFWNALSKAQRKQK